MDGVQGPAVSWRERFRDTTWGSGRGCVAAGSSAGGEATQAEGRPPPWVSSRPLTHQDQGTDTLASHQGGAAGPHHTQPSAAATRAGDHEEKEQARAPGEGRGREEGRGGGDTGI